MKRILQCFFIIVLSIFYFSCSKDDPIIDNPTPPDPPVEEETPVFPQKEMRAVWITTAWGLDWPQGVYSAEAQKKQYIAYLDKFVNLKINAVFMQIKPMGDAFYDSSYEPWSASITGTRGKVPSYDVLEFLINEAHARDLEFHAWMNPYRIATRGGSGTPYPPLHSSVDPSWVLSYDKIQIYNPALPEVRERLSDIVKEVITKYDVDGIHFDDYFYPSGVTFNDAADFEKYGKEYSTVEDFRRGNVNKAIKDVHDVIVATKPEVVFSVAPTSDNNYNMQKLFADVTKWGKEGWIDIMIPQLYHEIGHPTADFRSRLNWWTQYNYKAAVMAGHGFYRFGDSAAGNAFQTTAELEKQINLTRRNDKVVGNIMYRAKNILDNKIGITDQLAAIYKNLAVRPFVGRAVAPNPAEPTGLKLQNGKLKWKTTGDVRSVIYYFEDMKKEGVVFAITDKNEYLAGPSGHYCVSTINVDNKESEPSEFVEK